MKNDIWDEISSFLNGLRCEKINIFLCTVD